MIETCFGILIIYDLKVCITKLYKCAKFYRGEYILNNLYCVSPYISISIKNIYSIYINNIVVYIYQQEMDRATFAADV